MGTVLDFKGSATGSARTRDKRRADCEIVIFPGVRIERHDDYFESEPDLDLGHRIVDAAGNGDFDGLGGNNRPRRTS